MKKTFLCGGAALLVGLALALGSCATAPAPSAGGPAAGASVAAGRGVAKAGESSAAAAEGEARAEAPTQEEQAFLARYVEDMTYMVYFDEQAGEDPFYMKAAVGIANEYLASNGMEAIDLEQVEKLKNDRQRGYEEQAGRSSSLIQWIAQRLNADVYLQIDGRTTGEGSGGRYYGQASVTLKGFEASTGRLLGSQPWNSPRTFSTASEQAARLNALQTSVYKAMPIVLGQAKSYMAKALARGIRYELIVQGRSGGKALSDFRRKLKRRVKEVLTESQTAEETRYAVFLIGSAEGLAEAVLEVAGTIAGLEGMHPVVLRGKSVTFDIGK